MTGVLLIEAILAAAKGAEQKIAEILSIARRAARRSLDRDQADDIAQEIAIKAWEQLQAKPESIDFGKPLPPLVHRWVGQTIVAAANTLVGVGEERGDTGSPSRGAFVDLLLGEMRIAPLDGDVYVLWSPARKEFVRSGIIVAIEHMEKVSDGSMGYRCVTIDGDSDAITAAVGTKVLRSAACAERGGRRSVYSMDGDGWP